MASVLSMKRQRFPERVALADAIAAAAHASREAADAAMAEQRGRDMLDAAQATHAAAESRLPRHGTRRLPQSWQVP